MAHASFVLSALLLAGPAQAQTQADMNRTAAAAFTRADAALNRQYRTTMAAMKASDAAEGPPSRPAPTYQQALLKAQRAWLAYRDAECDLAGRHLLGGTAQPMEVLGCRTTLTEARTARLKTTTRR